MDKSSNFLFITGALFMLYGYLCRILCIYFFWDSKAAGSYLLGIGMISLVSYRAKEKLKKGDKAIIHMIAVIILIFILGLGIIFNIVIKAGSDSYDTAREFIKKEDSIINQIGMVEGFSLFTTGSVSTSTDSNGNSGHATYEFTVFGAEKFKDIRIRLTKNPKNPDWIVDSIE